MKGPGAIFRNDFLRQPILEELCRILEWHAMWSRSLMLTENLEQNIKKNDKKDIERKNLKEWKNILLKKEPDKKTLFHSSKTNLFISLSLSLFIPSQRDTKGPFKKSITWIGCLTPI